MVEGKTTFGEVAPSVPTEGWKIIGYQVQTATGILTTNENQPKEEPAAAANVKFIMTNPDTDQIVYEKTIETTEGSKIALTDLEGLGEVDGYSLDSWMDQDGNTYEASLGDFLAPAGDTTMYAQLTKNDTPDPIQKATVKFMVTDPETDEILFDQSVDT
ncbi:MAG: hypothetical protein KHZ24_07460, partial [Coriobacteriia bacterium]|nr:hypothetical protein [Coriobacteriia bacterium]